MRERNHVLGRRAKPCLISLRQPLTKLQTTSPSSFIPPFLRHIPLRLEADSRDCFKMTDKLPPTLLNLFAPRPPLRWVEPSDHAPEKRQTANISGVGQYLQALREYKENDGYVPSDSWLQKRDRKKLETQEKQEKLMTEGIKQCTTSPMRVLHAMLISPPL